MFRNVSVPPFILVLIGLAGLGFVTQLIKNPMGLISQLFFMAITVAIFFAIYKLFLQKRMSGAMGGKGSSAYQKAVKQSNRKHGQSAKVPKPKPVNSNKLFGAPSSSLKKTKSVSKKMIRPLSKKSDIERNFTVIEGKKGKKKNRAFF